MTTHEVLIGAFRKNENEQVRVRLVTFHDRPCLDIRVWARDGDSDTVPTKKGLALSVDKIGELKRLIDLADAQSNH